MEPKFTRQSYVIKNLAIEEIKPRKIRLLKTVLIIRYRPVIIQVSVKSATYPTYEK